MYKLANFSKETDSPTFIELLKSKWDEAHNTGTFRYKIDGVEQRIVDKYLLLLNPNRLTNRRAPESMASVCQPFDKNKFNFTKVSPREILFSIEDKDMDIHTVLVNVSPISRYHSLLCPSVNKCLPQVVTMESMSLAIEVMFVAQDRDLRFLFNSLCGFASVNHLHYHFFMETNDFYVENVNWEHIQGSLYMLDKNYSIPAFCFEVQKHSIAQTSKEIYKVIEHFLKKSIAHNILLTSRGRPGGVKDTVKVLVWPRKSSSGAKPLAPMNAAVLELSGWFPIYDRESFENLQASDLIKEQAKWRIEDFDKLCDEIKCLYV